MHLHNALLPWPGWRYEPLAVSPLIKLELRKENDHFGRYKTQGVVPKSKVSGQPVTPDVRVMTQTSELFFFFGL